MYVGAVGAKRARAIKSVPQVVLTAAPNFACSTSARASAATHALSCGDLTVE